VIRLLSMLALAAALVVALAGCGSSPSPQEKFASSVCSAVGDWSDQVKQSASDVKEQVQSPSTGMIAAIQKDVQAAIDATNTFVTSLGSISAPDSDEGQAAKQQLDALGTQVKSTVTKAQQTVKGIPDNAGIALFNNNSGGGSFSLANRFDAVGSTSEANTTYKEGTGYTALTPFSIDYAFVRDECGKGGSITTMGQCTISTPKDTDNNAADFYFVDTNGTSAGAGQRLGAPGPQNLASAIQRNSTITENLLDATVIKANPPNRVRDFTSVPAQNSTFGTLSIRRRFVNNTGGSITSLRFRVIDLTTFPAPSGFADLRPRTSGAVVVAGINDTVTCSATGAPATPPCTATVQGTTLDQPPSQPNGGGFNTTLSAGTVTLGTPLANGASINLQFLLGIQQTGNFKIYVNVEALP